MPTEIRRQSGAVDEVVAHGVSVHLERMQADAWFLEITEADGSSLAMWLAREKRSVVIRHMESRPPPEKK